MRLSDKILVAVSIVLIIFLVCLHLPCSPTLAHLLGGECTRSGSVTTHVAPAVLYPNDQYTTGVIATGDYATLTGTFSGGTYSQTNRNVTGSSIMVLKKEYGANCATKHEVDHFVPLALGGSNDVKNLWCQPESVMWNGNDWGFHKKDKLESLVIRMMKARSIGVSEAQQCIKTDWVACYLKYKAMLDGSAIYYGNVITPNDPDDGTF